MRYWLVVPAAGSGQRYGGDQPKQYAQLAGRTVLEWALAPFAGDSRCVGRVLVTAPGDERWRALPGCAGGAILNVPGGIERVHSVCNALRAVAGCAGPQEWVLVHDAARPCLLRADLDRLLAAGAAHPVGALLAVALSDTLKRAGEGAEVDATVARGGLWRALTPQMFRLGMLTTALDAALAAGRVPTDESQALEWQGLRPLLVPGSAANLKITGAADLALAEAYLTRCDALP